MSRGNPRTYASSRTNEMSKVRHREPGKVAFMSVLSQYLDPRANLTGLKVSRPWDDRPVTRFRVPSRDMVIILAPPLEHHHLSAPLQICEPESLCTPYLQAECGLLGLETLGSRHVASILCPTHGLEPSSTHVAPLTEPYVIARSGVSLTPSQWAVHASPLTF